MNGQRAWVFGSCIFLIAAIIMCVSLVVYAQDGENPRIASLSLRVNTEVLDRLWRETLTLLQADDQKAVLRKLEELDLQKVTDGFKNLPAQSAVLIRYAGRLQGSNRIDDAIALAEVAKRLSPDSASVYFMLAKLRLAKNMTDVYGGARELFLGVLTHYRDIGAIVVSANTILSVLLVAGVLTGIVFVVFSFLYYRQAVFYYLFKHVLPLPVPMFVASIMGWVVIGVVTLALGVFWGILLLAASLIFHVEKASRIALNLLLFFGSVLAVLLIALGTTFTQFESDYFQALRELSFGIYSAKTVTVLQEQVRHDPGDAYALFGLAYIAGHSGQDDEAIAVYSNLSFSYPGYAAAQNNLGALYHRKYLRDKTQASYKKAYDGYDSAIRSDRRLFEPRYNMAQLVLTDLSEADETKNNLLKTAMKLNGPRVSQLSQYLKNGIVATDANMSLAALVKKLFEPTSYESGLALAKKLWSSGSRFDNPLFFSAASLLVLILSALTGPSKTSPQKVSYCQMCGEPFLVKIRKRRPAKRSRDDDEGDDKKNSATEASNFCTQCTYIFKKKTMVKPEKRAQKVNQIQMRQNLRGLIAKIGSLLFPGGGQIYYGYPIKGLVLACSFYLGLSLLVLKVLGKSLLVTEGYAGWSLATLVVAGVLLGVAYLLNLLDILKLSPRNQ